MKHSAIECRVYAWKTDIYYSFYDHILALSFSVSFPLLAGWLTRCLCIESKLSKQLTLHVAHQYTRAAYEVYSGTIPATARNDSS